MGKLLTVLTAVWIIGILACAQRVAYWDGQAEEAVLDWYGQDPDHRHVVDEEVLAQQEAQKKATVWLSGTVLWAVLGALLLFQVRRWEREEAEEAEELAQAGQWTDRA